MRAPYFDRNDLFLIVLGNFFDEFQACGFDIVSSLGRYFEVSKEFVFCSKLFDLLVRDGGLFSFLKQIGLICCMAARCVNNTAPFGRMMSG